jgi:catechol 1,2-dioxygenase
MPGDNTNKPLEPEDTLNGAGRYDPNFTNHVVSSIGPNADPRLRKVMTSLIRHVHDFAREVDLTVDEWMAGVDMINRAGQMSTDRRNEGQLLCDVIGLESLVDEITFKAAADAKDAVTQSAILGPFFRHDAPLREKGDTISFDTPKDAEIAYMHGVVYDAVTKKPVEEAEIDIWQASTNGLYEQQDPKQQEHNLRGKFKTGKDGSYGFYCIRPTPYPVPDDGPAGELLKKLDRHPFRPAHIHLIVSISPCIMQFCMLMAICHRSFDKVINRLQLRSSTQSPNIWTTTPSLRSRTLSSSSSSLYKVMNRLDCN